MGNQPHYSYLSAQAQDALISIGEVRIHEHCQLKETDARGQSRQRPVLVTALAVLLALDAIVQGYGSLTTIIQQTSGPADAIDSMLMFVTIAMALVLTRGLWQLKNWARIGLRSEIVVSGY